MISPLPSQQVSDNRSPTSSQCLSVDPLAILAAEKGDDTCNIFTLADTVQRASGCSGLAGDQRQMYLGAPGARLTLFRSSLLFFRPLAPADLHGTPPTATALTVIRLGPKSDGMRSAMIILQGHG